MEHNHASSYPSFRSGCLASARRALLTVALALGVCSPAVRGSSANDATVHVLAAANEQIVWLCERRVDGDVSSLRLAYCRAADSEDLAFRPLRIPALTGNVVAATVRNENLHVFFSDGTHMRFVPPAASRPAVAHSVRGIEVGFPGRAMPELIFADSSTQMLYALVSGEVAARLPELVPDATDDEDDAALDDAELNDNAIAAEPRDARDGQTAAVVETNFAFVRYEGGAWVRNRWAPHDLDDEAGVVAVWVREGRIDLLVRGGSSADVVHRVSASSEDGWSSPVKAEIDLGDREVATGWTSDGPVLVTRDRTGSTTRTVGYRHGKAGWTKLPPLVSSPTSRDALRRASSIALMGARVVVVGVSAGAVEAGSWSITTGQELDAVRPVLAFAPTPPPTLDPKYRNFVPLVIFAAVLVYVFIARRDGGLFRVAVGPGEQVADLQSRFFAILLDMLFTSPVWGGILFVFMYDDLAALSMFEQMRNPTPALEMVLPVISIVEALYGLVFEIAMRATPGKRLMGLRVVAEGGGRASGGALVTRNLMRVLEFQFLAVAVLVFLTPSRQRLGDVLSRTLVVQRVSILPELDKQNEGESESTR